MKHNRKITKLGYCKECDNLWCKCDEKPKCSFCDRQEERLITNPKTGAYICWECVGLVNNMMYTEEVRPDESQRVD